MPSAAEMLSGLGNINRDLAMKYLGQMPENLSPVDQERFISDMIKSITTTGDLVDNISDHTKITQESIENIVPLAKSKFFNLVKESQIANDMPSTYSPSPLVDPMSNIDDVDDGSLNSEGMQQFADASSVRDYLMSTQDVSEALSFFGNVTSDDKTEFGENTGRLVNPKQIINDSVKTFYEGKGTMNSQDQLSIASTIFEVLPESIKIENDQDTSLMAVREAPNIVASTNLAIRKAAEILAKSRRGKTFNIKRFAQHKGFDNMMLYGPGQTSLDAFTGNLISKLHLVERNKGFGLKVDDVLDIDFEAIWRGTVMDKYSREYRDKDGQWVGGYLNKRFEINRYVPEGNSYQLKPGQKRRPYLPEYRSLESRLDHMRKTEGDDRGYGPKTSSFNLNSIKKMAEKKKNCQIKANDDYRKVSYLKPLAPLPEDPLSSAHDQKANRISKSKTCPTCNSTNAAGNAKCENCGTSLVGLGMTYHPHQVSPKGERPSPSMSVTPNQRLAQNIINPNSLVNNIKKRPLPNKKIIQISDPDAENTDNMHLNNVNQSANALGL